LSLLWQVMTCHSRGGLAVLPLATMILQFSLATRSTLIVSNG
jgi:hypothetical protein